jgi:predicted ABC-type ATPase
MPWLWMIAGANGAGKTTGSRLLLPKELGCLEFVNADLIAAGLSPYNTAGVAVRAGRLMLERIELLLKNKQSFAFETTGASLTFVSFINRAKQAGYQFGLLYIWLPSPAIAVARVAARVRQGGHFVPEEDVRRRWQRGKNNVLQHYWPMAQEAHVYNGVLENAPIAEKKNTLLTIHQSSIWKEIQQ